MGEHPTQRGGARTKKAQNLTQKVELPVKPPSATHFQVTLDGQEFDAAANLWRLVTAQKRVRFDFALPRASSGLCRHVKSVLAARVAAGEVDQAYASLSLIRILLRASKRKGGLISRFTAADVLNYQAGLSAYQRPLAGRMRDVLRRWAKTGEGGLEPCLLELLPTMEVQRAEMGTATRTWSATRGALTAPEQERVLARLHDLRRSARLSVDNYGMALVAVISDCGRSRFLLLSPLA